MIAHTVRARRGEINGLTTNGQNLTFNGGRARSKERNVVWDSVWAVQNDQHRGVLVTNKTLLQAETN